MKVGGVQPGRDNPCYASDVPDDLCYHWAEEYFKEREMQMYQEKQEKTPHITAWRAYGQKIFTTPASRRIGYGLTGIMCMMGIQCLFFVDFIYGLLPWLMGGFLAGAGVLAAAWIFRHQHHGTRHLDADAVVPGDGICLPE